MADKLPVPPELQHLIEKRQSEADRREAERRQDEQRQVDLGPLGALESAESIEDIPLEERRGNEERRQEADRRSEEERRSADPTPPAAE